MNDLYIDTTNNKNVIVKLIRDDCEFVRESEKEHTRADSVLQLILLVCADGGISLQEINNIYCNKGPGSFTGLRVGFAIANTLSLALLIPLNDNKLGTIDTPVYI